jgi:hypothetical protein
MQLWPLLLLVCTLISVPTAASMPFASLFHNINHWAERYQHKASVPPQQIWVIWDERSNSFAVVADPPAGGRWRAEVPVRPRHREVHVHVMHHMIRGCLAANPDSDHHHSLLQEQQHQHGQTTATGATTRVVLGSCMCAAAVHTAMQYSCRQLDLLRGI